MIVTSEPPPYKDVPEAGPSTSNNVPFRDEPGFLVDVSDSTEQLIPLGGEQPPPAFAPYEAECFTSGGNTIAHDAHLNTDGEALYRFLLSQSTTPPTFQLHCRGTHSETRYRHVNHRRDDGSVHTRTESYTEHITDFDFYIDVSDNLSGPIHWSVGDEDPVYRGAMVREIDTPVGKRKAKRAENKLYKAWVEDRNARGLPPWVSSVSTFAEGINLNATVLKSSKSLREWADEYCTSPKYLKEFSYEKVVYGWNVRQLENAVRAAIVASPYSGELTVEFKTTANKIYIRPDNRLSRLLSNKWFKFLTYILILPFLFIWLFKRFHPRGGGTWAVCGGAYALKAWVPVSEAELAAERRDVKGASSSGSSSSAIANANGRDLVRTPAGSSRLIGRREGEWFRAWQPTIVRAVTNRFQSPTPLYTTTEEGLPDAYVLDGY